jgi:hypothetical protein
MREMPDCFIFQVGRTTLLLLKISAYHIKKSFKEIFVRLSVVIAPLICDTGGGETCAV